MSPIRAADPFACRVTGQHRATQRHQPAATTPVDPDAALRTWLRAYAGGHPRRGFRPAYHDAHSEGRNVNHNKIQRLWREEGLRVPQRQHRTCRGTSTTIDAPTADAPNQVWALREFRLPDDLREQKDRALDKPDSSTP
jgi:putative transposase